MPRERTLAHGFFENHLLAGCQPLTRLLFQGLWTLADYDGCFKWEPEALAMKLLPRDQFDAVAAMEDLSRLGFIRQYEAKGEMYGYMVNWLKYQDPHPREKPTSPKPVNDQQFMVRVKHFKYRAPEDLAFGRTDILPGRYHIQQLASNLLATGQQPASNAYPSYPSYPSIPTKEEQKASPPAPLAKRKNGFEIEHSELLIGFYGSLVGIYPKNWLQQGVVPKTTPSIGLDRAKTALGEIERATKGKGLVPEVVLAKALEFYLAESRGAGQYLVGLGVWLSPVPKEGKANYRQFIPRAVSSLTEETKKEAV